MILPETLLTLLRQPSLCYIATTMPDGSPQLSETWVDTDGENILINTVQGFQKLKNVARDPRVSLAISDPANVTRYTEVRGRVLSATTEGGVDSIEKLAQKYIGKPYPWYGGRDQVRVVMTIEALKIRSMG